MRRLLLLAPLLLLILAGCQSQGHAPAVGDSGPRDLVPSTTYPGQLVVASDDQAQVLADTQPNPAPLPNTPQPDAGYTLNAMVGQVNGRAIYANVVFNPIHEQLQALARRLTRNDFRQQAQRLIAGRVQQIVTDALIYGEAERDLSEGEQQGLKQLVKTKREELLRFWGMGSPTLADDRLMRETGLTLNQTVEDWRQQAVVRKYLQEKLIPRINVTRREVERYYHDHEAEFKPAVTRTVRLIRVNNDEDAWAIGRLLSRGQSFEQVAQNPINQYKPSQGGLFGENIGSMRQGAVNTAMLALKEGEHAGPVAMNEAQWFVFVEQLNAPESRTLQQAQIDIEVILRNRQYQALSEEYRADLFRYGSYNSIEQMARELIEIAMNRYAPQG